MKKLYLILFTALAACNASAQVDLNKGLVLYLPFNGNTLDASPNGNNAINYGASLTTDQWGNANSAYRFDGSTNYMRIPDSSTLHIDSQITLSARVSVKGFYDDVCYANSIIDKGFPDFIPGSYKLRFSTSKAAGSCYIKDTTKQNFYGAFYNQFPSEPIRDNAPYVMVNTWQCLVYTFDGVKAKMYVNGVLRHQYDCSSSIGFNTQDLLLGRHGNPSYPYWFNGIMDEVRIYNRAININEIDSLCANSIQREQRSSIYESKQIELLPIINNPVSEELILNLPSNKMGGQLTIIDMTGRILITEHSLQKNSITLETIPSGMYIITYQFNDVYFRTKILKK